MTSLRHTDRITHQLSNTVDRLSDTANRWPDRQPVMTDSIKADRQSDGQAQGQRMKCRQTDTQTDQHAVSRLNILDYLFATKHDYNYFEERL